MPTRGGFSWLGSDMLLAGRLGKIPGGKTGRTCTEKEKPGIASLWQKSEKRTQK
jgi:hypothetical protein